MRIYKEAQNLAKLLKAKKSQKSQKRDDRIQLHTNLTKDYLNNLQITSSKLFSANPNAINPKTSFRGFILPIMISTCVSSYGASGGYKGGTSGNDYIGNSVSQSSVTIDGGDSFSNVYGGYSAYSTSSPTNNTVTVNGGSISGNVYGGYGNADSVSYNTIVINGGTISGNIYGAYSSKGYGSATTSNNTIIINGGSIGGGEYIWSSR